MLVETYEQTEVDAAGVVECDAEALELIESLGLTGQQSLLSKRESGEQVRCPYRLMTQEEGFLFRQLFKKHTPIKQFQDSPIPVRVLQVAAHAREHFTHLIVWSPESDADRDPLLIGHNESHDFVTTGKQFILARCGEALDSMPTLFSKAVASRRAEIQATCHKAITRATACLNSLEAIPDAAVPAMSIPTYYE